MKIKIKLFIVISLILALAAGLNLSLAPQGQASQGEAIVLSSLQPRPTAPIQMYARGYVYPIAELSNCSSKQACFEFCEQLANLPLCAMFAQKQGMMKIEMVPVAQRLAVGLLSSSSFAGCGTATKCVQLCDEETNAESCADLADTYQLSSRVLGASDGAGTDTAAGGESSSASPVWAANPYANLNQNYSNPALTNYLASTAGSNCPPLDMVCLSRASQQVSPRVLNISAHDQLVNGDGDSGGGWTDGGGYAGNAAASGSQDTASEITNCANNAAAGIINRDESTILPAEADSTAEQIRECNQGSGEAIAAGAETAKQESIGGILGFQNCINGSKNIALDISRCINQELR